ncbi:TPA: HsdR family type I site-specific deoxyribonuclease [Pasteurella multocida]|uniref:type I restriction endonuclease subunit R n=1 Tax=Pasteurella multocida TaxID=747 RepID=UPI0020231ADD|nr:HsdR family type I site-specific deoxyribonuclease [Pasteurella multocida]URH79457.1 HsdR family type I site-specific deoxyribonuclease [Pasteurella multocida]URH81531.1 HsdR family type I site-specific deoxyribonuclease [Pasteurella multocida]HDR1040005.1 HsdR family type I site-specific deoxyribonuclease [Pasteurella multocida]HDR1140724.1 HsdR family type I site-specific deoxyribonuclease [Pasteurella multocida]HDR1143841.1 HsdR family type I site-specific deoxyribonuclease [Pasteurella 
MFNKEADFENALITLLQTKGWEKTVLHHPTEEDLIANWQAHLNKTNQHIDKLDVPLIRSEMAQILEQVQALKTPYELNRFINGKTVAIKRENEESRHFGKEISLDIFDRAEISAGKSRYQIAQQPHFSSRSDLYPKQRGDVMLLINGMPMFHIELKRSNTPISQATNQIERYHNAGAFSGIFSLVQIFVAMTPEECRYFSNSGNKLNPAFYFRWADFNNVYINAWDKIGTHFLSIPMAHQFIGDYTIADSKDEQLKVLRSYQYYAVNKIADTVAKTNWTSGNQRGGYIWHTTGSGKTVSSFKAAQLISRRKDADKVIFLLDRIELGKQSLEEYQNFADRKDDVQATENTVILLDKLKSKHDNDRLIVTSIQKMSNIKAEEGVNEADIAQVSSKNVVFIIDEAHRTTFGDMLLTIKQTFPNAIFFGFTGTPIEAENAKKNATTSTIFGNELHRYSIADGIRDENVLGFHPFHIRTFKDSDLRRVVALEVAKSTDESEVFADEAKKKIYNDFMNNVPMAGFYNEEGKYQEGIEDYVPNVQYQTEEHVNAVVNDMLENWQRLSQGKKYHAIFATSSIPEAVNYYRLIKARNTGLKLTALFDPSIMNDGQGNEKEKWIAEILDDYNHQFDTNFGYATYAKFKTDLSDRLSHIKAYKNLKHDEQLDLLIVVDQMLTGFDSKWINTLYLDKILDYANLIQAFSRTNRLCDKSDKPFGLIRYYRKPHTMQRNIERAVKLYSGDRPMGLFVDNLDQIITKMNVCFTDIADIFKRAGQADFAKNPDDSTACAKFVKLFNQLNDHLHSARLLGFVWEQLSYDVVQDDDSVITATLTFDRETYDKLLARYKDLFTENISSGGSSNEQVPFDLRSHINEIETDKIDQDYMNARFDKWLKAIGRTDEAAAFEELHHSFATLSKEDQKFAEQFLHDVQSGDIQLDPSWELSDYIADYKQKNANHKIQQVIDNLGLDGDSFREMLARKYSRENLDLGKLKALKGTVDKEKAKVYFKEERMIHLNRLIDAFLRSVITGEL